jgi:hypothetical protein
MLNGQLVSIRVFRKDEILKNHMKKHEHLEIRTTAVKMPQETVFV